MSIILIIVNAAIAQGVPPELLLSICWTESNHKPYVTNFDDGGRNSHGLCQIQTNTAKHMGFTGKVKELYNPKINAKYAAKYLKYQLKRYNNNWFYAAAAYNAGHLEKK